MIELKEALREIDSKDFRDNNGNFSLLFMTCDVNRNTGGELIELTNACKCGLPPGCKGHEMRGIKDMETGKPYAVHNRLIFQFNKKPIFWV
jgi:hypothetical protein